MADDLIAEPDVLDEPASSPYRTAPAPAEADAGSDPDADSGGWFAAQPNLAERVWRRIWQRPVRWATSPWPNSRIVQYVVTVLTLTTCTVIMCNVVHLSFLPGRDLIFDDTTPTGGDFGAHVWGPAYLRDHLLPAGWFNGWTMDWYAGMPAYRFYMVLPAMAILIADVFLKYGVAMKLVAVLGLVTFPASCWAFGRLAKFRYPIPELMAFGGLAFVLDDNENFEIYGGNLKSTMAGEFSFSISLSLGVLALGFLAAGLRTGKYRVIAPVLLAAAAVSHGIVLIYLAVAALVFCLIWIDRERWKYAVGVGVTAVLLMMWWVGPFLLNHAYMTDMKYGARPEGADDSFWDMFFPHDTALDLILTALAAIGFIMSIARRQLNGAALGVTCLVFVALTYVTRDSLPVIGLLWNPRLLPFIYLLRYLLMAIGAFELLALAWNAFADRRAQTWPALLPATGMWLIVALGVLVSLGWVYQELPGGRFEVKHDNKAAVYTWGPFSAPQGDEQTRDAQGDGWSRYNFMGYEGRGSYYTEYYDTVQTMARLGDDPQYGCGRAMWENHKDNGPYGTTMALMLLPFWTDGCIGSMEGLFFEASGTTPYHFLTAAAMSESSSNPVRQLRYENRDAEVGVRHLQDLGVRYVMVRTDAAKARADARPELTLVAESYPWNVYVVAGSDIVEPLAVQPVVVAARSGDQRERNLELGTSWFQHPEEWVAMPADGGPEAWQRIDVQVDESRHSVNGQGKQNQVDVVVPTQAIEPVALPAVTVSNLDIRQQSLSFDVDQAAVDARVPVLVKVSYFPNWSVSGADGPWRVGPNMMVVVPTSTHVSMSFDQSFSDYFTALLTLFGIGLCVWWRRRGDMVFVDDQPGLLFGRTDVDDGFDPADAYVYDDNEYREYGDADDADDALWADPGRDDDVTPIALDAPPPPDAPELPEVPEVAARADPPGEPLG